MTKTGEFILGCESLQARQVVSDFNRRGARRSIKPLVSSSKLSEPK